MFDNPQKTLKNLEEELQALEQNEDNEDLDETAWVGEPEADIWENSNQRKRTRAKAAVKKIARKQKETPEKPKKTRKVPFGGQLLLAILEIILIIVIIRWWLQWIA